MRFLKMVARTNVVLFARKVKLKYAFVSDIDETFNQTHPMRLLASIQAYHEVIRRIRLDMHRIDQRFVSYLDRHRQKELS